MAKVPKVVTAEAWVECPKPFRMIDVVQDTYSQRKLLLAAVACWRRIWHLLPDQRSRNLVEMTEKFAEGKAQQVELDAAREIGMQVVGEIEGRPFGYAASAVTMPNYRDMFMTAAEATAWVKVGTPEAISEPEEKAQSAVIREVFGNPFRPVTVSPSWQSANVVALAQTIYDEKAFDRMPILADALEDAGCDNAEILNHCRQPGEHVRGCWVVDLLLNKK